MSQLLLVHPDADVAIEEAAVWQEAGRVGLRHVLLTVAGGVLEVVTAAAARSTARRCGCDLGRG